MSVILLAIGCAGSSGLGRGQAREHYDRAVAHYSREKYDDAIEEYQLALQDNSRLVAAHFGLGVAYIHTGFYRGAVLALRNALELRPGYSGAHYNLGLAYFHLREYRSAIGSFEEAQSQEPSLKEVLLPLGQAYSAIGDTNLSVTTFQSALEHGSDLKVHVALAEIFESQGEIDLAVEQYMKVTAVDSTAFQVWYKIGILYETDGKPKEAIAAFESALSVGEGEVGLMLRLAGLNANGENLARAESLYRQVLEADPTHALAHFNLGLILDRTGQSEAAIEAYVTAIQLKPDMRKPT